MTILAIDPAVKFGWASHDNSGIKSGVMDLGIYEDDADKARTLYQFIRDIRPVLLVIERPFGFGTHRSRLEWLCCAAHMAAASMGTARHEYIANQWRKGILGRNPRGTKACKLAVMEWARAQGFDPEDDNEADAIGLISYELAKQ